MRCYDCITFMFQTSLHAFIQLTPMKFGVVPDFIPGFCCFLGEIPVYLSKIFLIFYL